MSKTTAITAIDAANPPIVNKVEYRGNVQHIPFVYTVAVETATIEVSKKLPSDSKVIGVRLNITGDIAVGTLALGYVGATGAIKAVTSVATAGVYEFVGAPVDVGGKAIIGTIVSDTVDQIDGYILVVTNEA
jgi:hypothetical protein